MIVQKHLSSSPAKKQSTQKVLQKHTHNMSSLTMEFPEKSSLTETHASLATSPENYADSLESNKISAQPTTPKLTDKAKEPISHLNNTSGLSAQMIKTHGQTGYHLHNTSEIHGHLV